MKRFSSATKENGNKHAFKLTNKKKPLEHHQSSLSSTQTFFPNNKS